MKTITEPELFKVWKWISDKYPSYKWGYRLLEDEPKVRLSLLKAGRKAIFRVVPNNWDLKQYTLEYISMKGEFLGQDTEQQKSKGEKSGEQSGSPIQADRPVPGRKGDANVRSDGVPQE